MTTPAIIGLAALGVIALVGALVALARDIQRYRHCNVDQQERHVDHNERRRQGWQPVVHADHGEHGPDAGKGERPQDVAPAENRVLTDEESALDHDREHEHGDDLRKGRALGGTQFHARSVEPGGGDRR